MFRRRKAKPMRESPKREPVVPASGTVAVMRLEIRFPLVSDLNVLKLARAGGGVANGVNVALLPAEIITVSFTFTPGSGPDR